MGMEEGMQRIMKYITPPIMISVVVFIAGDRQALSTGS
jgi:hypothetical protein